MEIIWLIAIAVAIFLVISLFFYKILKGYVINNYGDKWLTAWGNKVYFWQSIILVSTGGTTLIMYILKWSNVLTF